MPNCETDNNYARIFSKPKVYFKEASELFMIYAQMPFAPTYAHPYLAEGPKNLQPNFLAHQILRTEYQLKVR